jgi:hypothetical protein
MVNAGPAVPAEAASKSGRRKNSVGNDDTIGGRTGAGSPTINTATTGTPTILANP